MVVSFQNPTRLLRGDNARHQWSADSSRQRENPELVAAELARPSGLSCLQNQRLGSRKPCCKRSSLCARRQCAVTGNISAHLSSLQKMQPHDVFQCCVDRHCRRVWPGRAAARSTANSANWAVFRYTFTAPANIPTVQERLGKWIPAAQHSAAMCLPAQQCGLATWAAS